VEFAPEIPATANPSNEAVHHAKPTEVYFLANPRRINTMNASNASSTRTTLNDIADSPEIG
jgi:hypothetical protein